LIAIQSTLTAVLAICIAVNAIYAMYKQNPHTQKRKEAEKLREADLTPLDARNSLLSDAAGQLLLQQRRRDVARHDPAALAGSPAPAQLFLHVQTRPGGRGFAYALEPSAPERDCQRQAHTVAHEPSAPERDRQRQARKRVR
jgi:hypothetical protein